MMTVDELAAAANADPVEFRLRLLTASTDDDDIPIVHFLPRGWLSTRSTFSFRL